jgi:hypothetical protein
MSSQELTVRNKLALSKYNHSLPYLMGPYQLKMMCQDSVQERRNRERGRMGEEYDEETDSRVRERAKERKEIVWAEGSSRY